MAADEPQPTSFLAELRRRSVFRVAAAYLVVGWLALQFADVTFEPLHLPKWAMTLVVTVYILGLPVALAVAWAYEITPSGLRRDSSPGIPGGARLKRAAGISVVALVSAAVAVAGVAWWRWLQQSAANAPASASIAVLPLVDMSPEGSSGYLGDGLSEELSSHLADVPGLRVAARTSAFAYKGKQVDVREIGRQLGVRYVLEGSVRREGDRLRVTAQLIDARTGYHAWTRNYDRDWRDLLGIQQELSMAITEQLKVVLTPEQREQFARAPTTSARAYDFYLAGLAKLREGGGLSRIEEAQRLFRLALDADPGFARAHAGLCTSEILRYDRTRASDAMTNAEAECQKALEADASLRETEIALASLYVTSDRFPQAERLYRGLLARDPADSDLHSGLGRALEASGALDDAERSYREGVSVEPGYWGAHNQLGNFLFRQGRARDAAESYRQVTQLAPGNATGFNNLGGALLLDGNFAGAAAAFQRSIEIEPSRSAYSNLGTVLYYQGRFAEAVDMYGKARALAGEDHQVWGAYADALWYVPGRRKEAVEAYGRAVFFAERALAVDASSAESWAALGYYYSRAGELDKASRYLEKAMQLGPALPYVYYCAALVAAGRGDRAVARELAAKAEKLGYSEKLIAADPVLSGSAKSG